MATKISYSNTGSLPAYGSRQVKPLSTSQVQVAPAYSARSLASAASSAQAPDILARVLASGQDTFAQPVKPATTAPPASTAAPAANPGATTAAAGSTIDMGQLAADPILAAIKAAGDRSVAEAAGVRNTGYEDALTRFGDRGLAQSTLKGLGLSDAEAGNFATAASGNPTSTLAQLLQAHNANVNDVNTGENKANLFYSSDRANKLGHESQNYLNGQASAQDALHQLLASYDAAYRGARGNADAQGLQGTSDAYGRLITNILNGLAGAPPPDASQGSVPTTEGLSGAARQAASPLTALLTALAGVGPGAPAGRLQRYAG